MIEGQKFGDALTGGVVSGITAGFFPPTGGAAAGGTGFSLSSLGEGIAGAFGNVKDFLAAPLTTIKAALPSLAELPDIAVEKIQAELQRLPENAMNSALDMLKGADPGGVLQAIQGGGDLTSILGSIGQGVIANNAAKDVIQQNQKQFEQAIGLQRETRDLGITRSEPFAQAGVQSLAGLQEAAARGPAVLEDTGSTLEEVNPLVSFLRQQGFSDIQESAAAKGQLQSGGTLKGLTQFNTDLTSTIVPQLQQQKFAQNLQKGQFAQQGRQQQFGNLFDVARLGANAVAGQNTQATNAANSISTLRQNFAGTQADATANRANVLQSTIQDLLIR
jgi:hypothetical protein